MKAFHLLALALALSIAVAGLALANDGVRLPRDVLAGGSSDCAAEGVSLRATLGQPVVGAVAGSSPGGDVTLGPLPVGRKALFASGSEIVKQG